MGTNPLDGYEDEEPNAEGCSGSLLDQPLFEEGAISTCVKTRTADLTA
jgi:hypothetical protein